MGYWGYRVGVGWGHCNCKKDQMFSLWHIWRIPGPSSVWALLGGRPWLGCHWVWPENPTLSHTQKRWTTLSSHFFGVYPCLTTKHNSWSDPLMADLTAGNNNPLWKSALEMACESWKKKRILFQNCRGQMQFPSLDELLPRTYFVGVVTRVLDLSQLLLTELSWFQVLQ